MIALAQFFPTTLGAWAAVIAAIAAPAAAAVSYLNRKNIQEVHVLVNSQLSEIKRELDAVTKERDHLLPAARRINDTETPNA